MTGKVHVAIIGAGLMGHGIAQVFAAHGHAVRIHDASAQALADVHRRVRDNLLDLGWDPSAAAGIEPCAVLADAVRDADVVFEAGPENLQLKQQLFAQIETFAPRAALLASNTSVIPISRIMGGLRHRDRALGTHWWNPPYLVPLVEVIQTADTSAKSMQRMTELLAAAGKTPVTVRKDVPGFVGNRLQHALWREAIALVQSGVCDAETVDTVVKSSFGRRLAVLGPLENADLVGTDLTLVIHDTVLPDLDRSAEAQPYLREMVASGRLGMKSGEGFRRWSAEDQARLRQRVLAHLKALNEQQQ